MSTPSDLRASLTGRIDLAVTPSFALGPLEVIPAAREVRAGASHQTAEPRVLQVLIALAQARGETVSRDALVHRCWEGRAVGEDAIQRAIAKARRLADMADPPAFEIESIARVGYRLRSDEATRADPAPAPRAPRGLDRRWVLGGAAAATTATLGAVAWSVARPAKPPLSPEAQALLDKGREALNEGLPDRASSALGLLRRATEAAPDSAETWGALALGYQWVSGRSESGEAAQYVIRAREAARRALSIDPNNADAVVALATLDVPYGHWLTYEAACSKALARFPRHGWLNAKYANLLSNVGRIRAGVDHYGRAAEAMPLQPQLHWPRGLFLWAAGRLDEADATLNRAFALWPRHYAVWHTRFRVLCYTGRTEAALAQVADVGGRPMSEPDWNFDLCRGEALAVRSREPAEVEAALALYEQAMTRGSAHAVNGIQLASAVGRLDKAFSYAEAYFLGRGLKLAAAAYSTQQGIYYPRSNRVAWHLFLPNTASLRADARFAPLTRAIGLEDYWARSRTQPDYRLA